MRPTARLGILLCALAGEGAWASHAVAPLNLTQRNADGTALCVGCTSTEAAGIELTATSDPATCATGVDYSLEFEVVPTTSAFTGTPNNASPVMSGKPNCVAVQYAWTSLPTLTPGTSYKWQVREKVGTAVSTWVQFNAGQAAFVAGTIFSNHLAMTSAAQNLAVGACSGAVTVEHRNTSGQPQPVSAALAVNLTSSDGSLSYFSDASCATAATSVTIPAGGTTASFRFKGSVIGSPQAIASGSGVGHGRQTQAVTAGPPAQIVFSVASTSLVVGNCVTLTIELRDSGGNPANNTAQRVLNLSSSNPDLSFQATNGNCNKVLTSVIIKAGENTGQVRWTGVQPGTGNLIASATGMTAGSLPATARARIVFQSATQSVTVGDCSGLASVQLFESGNQVIVPTQSVQGDLTGTGFTFFSNPACTAAISSLTFPAGQSTASFYWKNTLSGARSISVSGPLLQSSSQSQTLIAGPPVALAFTSPSRTVTAGACSAVVTLQIRDSYGNPSPVTAATPVTLTSSSGSIQYFSNATCTTAVSGVTVLAGASSASFYFRDTTLGGLTVTANAPPLTGVTQGHTITNSVPTTAAFVTPAQTVPLESCSLVATVETRNGFGVPTAPGSNLTGPLASAPVAVSFFSDPSCTTPITTLTVPAGGTQASFHFSSANPGSTTLSWDPPSLTAAVQSAQLGSLPTKLAMSTPPHAVQAGDCSPQVDVQARDAADNPAAVQAATPVNLTSNSGTLGFFSDSGCISPITQVTIPAGGVSESFYFRDTAAGTRLLAAAAGGLTSASQSHSIFANEPAGLFVASGPASVAAGACSAQVVVEARDAFGNPSPAAAATPVALSASGGGMAYYSDATCATAVSGVTLAAGATQVAFRVRATATGSHTVTATVTGITPATHPLSVTPGAAAQLAFTVQPSNVVAGASIAPAVQVTVRDAQGNTVTTSSANVTLAFGANPGSGMLSGTATVAASGGVASFANLSINRSGAGYTLVATSGTLTSATSSTFNVAAGAANRVAFAIQPSNVVAGASITPAIQVAIQDALGNTVTTSSANVTVAIGANPGTGTLSGTATVAASGGVASFANLSINRSGTGYTLVANSGTLTSATSATFNVTAGAANRVAFTVQPSNTAAGAGISPPVQVAIQDALGNTVTTSSASVTVALGANPGGSVLSGTAAIGASSGLATFSGLSLDKAGAGYTLTASSGTLIGATSATFNVGSGVATALVFVTPPRTAEAGACSQVLQVERRDALGNPAPSASASMVTFASTAGGTGFFTNAGCTTAASSVALPAGVAMAEIYFRDPQAGMPSISATTAMLAPGAQVHTVTAGPPAVIQFASAPVTTTAGGCAGPLALALEDAFGNAATASGPLVLPLTSGAAGTTFHPSAGCGSTVTAVTVATGQSGAVFYFRHLVAQTVTLTASGSGLTAASQLQTVGAGAPAALVVSGHPSPVTAGTTQPFQVSAADAFGNRVTSYGGMVSFSSSDPAATLPAPYTFVGADQGERTFQTTFATAGTHSLTVEDGAAPPLTGSQAGIVVEAGVAVSLRVFGVSPPVLAGAPVAVQVEALDAMGARATAYTGAVVFSSDDPAAVAGGAQSFAAADQGLAAFPAALTFGSAGSWELRATDASDPGLTGALAGIQVIQAQGGACLLPADCASGVCEQGVCCDRTCAGACEACNLAGGAGTCSAVPDGQSCEDGQHCNGLELCQGGACAAGAQVTCVDPAGEAVMACVEDSRSCEPVPSPPIIARDAFLQVAVGAVYRFNARGAVQALGSRPMTFQACGGPPDFRVDPSTGAVFWRPLQVGQVALCVRAQNALGADQYDFAVDVVVASGAGPTARFTVSPGTGAPGQALAFDGSGSTADPSSSLVAWSWDFGDVSPLAVGEAVDRSFPVSMGLVPRLTVYDDLGRTDTAEGSLRVGAAPLARIAASARAGEDALEVELSCACEPGDAPIASVLWLTGRTVLAGERVVHTFGPGRHRVRVLAFDAAGKVGMDWVEIAVVVGGNEPPFCRLSMDPPAGAAPLEARIRASFFDADGEIASHRLEVAGQPAGSGAGIDLQQLAAGRYFTLLEVEDQGGLACTDPAELVSVADGRLPPRIVSTPPEPLSCGVAWGGAAEAVGAGPLEWTLEPVDGAALPDGLTVDPQSGELAWLPEGGQRGTHLAVLRVDGPGGSDRRQLELDVECGDPRILTAGCGCAAGPGDPLSIALWFAGAALVRRLRKRRRS